MTPKARSAAWWLDQVGAQERRGELLSAFDLAERALEEHPGNRRLEHRAVLALARTGATEEAARRLEAYGLIGSEDEDIAALGARIEKDIALAGEGHNRLHHARRAAERYGEIFARTGGYYPAINAATLWLVAGERARARELATTVLGILAVAGETSYWSVATEAEARLLLGDVPAARDALDRAAGLHDKDYAAVASTRRQLRLLCDLQATDPGLLDVLAGPFVVHFCGHRIGARFAADAEAAVSCEMARVIERHAPGAGYGSLASGADILWAEALLAAGSELHVVLPCSREDFVEVSVASSGFAWETRFVRCLEAASSVRYATEDPYLGDDVLFRYCAELAMGLALLRARYLDAEVRQLAVWDGSPSENEAGTAADIGTWCGAGRSTIVVAADGSGTAELAGANLPAATPPRSRGAGRVIRAILFGDVRGFSRLHDLQLVRFSEVLLAAIARTIERHAPAVEVRNTWGDALYLVLTDAVAAAGCALDIQDAITAIDLAAEGLPDHVALRLAAHLGPVLPHRDPILDQPAFLGSHISRTARIEPVTPPGTVYVTEPFAAALVLSRTREFTCDYVGHMPAAKAYGRLRMYRLRRTTPSSREAGGTRAGRVRRGR